MVRKLRSGAVPMKIQQSCRVSSEANRGATSSGWNAHLCGSRRRLRVVSYCQLAHYTGNIVINEDSLDPSVPYF
jgi:hypothetical protein